MYMNRLDGQITAKFVDEKAAQWRELKPLQARDAAAPTVGHSPREEPCYVMDRENRISRQR